LKPWIENFATSVRIFKTIKLKCAAWRQVAINWFT